MSIRKLHKTLEITQKAKENKSIFRTKDATQFYLWHSTKQDRLGRQIATVLICFKDVLNLNMIQCCQPAVAITVSYKPSVQQVQTSERKQTVSL